MKSWVRLSHLTDIETLQKKFVKLNYLLHTSSEKLVR